MYDGHGIIDGLCDKCGHPRVSELAETYTDVMKNGNWVKDWRNEYVRGEWGDALNKAAKELTTKVVKINIDCEELVLCSNCLKAILKDLENTIEGE